VPVGVLGAIAAMAFLARSQALPAGLSTCRGFVCIAVALFSLLLASSRCTSLGLDRLPVC